MEKVKKIIRRIIVIALILAVVFSLMGLYSVYTNYLEINETGSQYTSIFFKDMFVKAGIWSVSFLSIFALTLINLLILRKIMLGIDVSFESIKKLPSYFLLSLVIAFFGSGYIKEAVYSQYLMFANSVPYGVTDPIFGRDISYYIFKRPFLKNVADSFIIIELFLTFITACAYAVLYGKLGFFSIKDVFKQKKIFAHIASNVIIILIVRAISYRFRSEEILYSSFNGLNGAGYVDVNIWSNFYKIAPYLLILCVVSAITFMYRGKIKSVLISFAVYPAVLIIVTATAAFTQYFIVTPSEVQAESEYIGHNIEFTKMAYGLDKIKEKSFSASNNLTEQIISDQKETLDNIRIIDYNSTQIIASQLQSLRNYYEFKDLDIAAMKINGEKRPIATMVREIKKTSGSATTTNYINDKLRFTHGYGLVTMPINEVSKEGQPIFYSKDIPMTFENGITKVTEPRIYYGEYKDSYSVVNTTVKEFDYLDGEKNIETVYTGKSGIPLTAFNRFIFSLKEGDYQLLVSRFITKDSKLLINKNVLDRVKKAAPFLTFDDDPYSITDKDGRIKWVIDAFTKTNEFPYSQKYEGINYIRNSAKAVVDAYDGTVTIYITDNDDVLIRAYQKMYPNVFSQDPMPEDLRYSIKYCENYFKIQAEMLKRYHISDTTTFYNKSDVWDIAYELKEEQAKLPVEPYYSMVKLDGEKEANLVVMLPFTIAQKDNMVSWLSAGSDGDCYGELTLYKFPQGKNVYGPLQMEKRFSSDTAITREMTLWGQGNSEVIRGNMLTIPVGESLIYIEPVYITSDKNSFPELKMVIGSYGNKISMKPTLKEVFADLFSDLSAISDLPTPDTGSDTETATEETAPNGTDNTALNEEEVRKAFNELKKASSDNDWVAFGEALDKLDKLINPETAQKKKTPFERIFETDKGAAEREKSSVD